MSEPPSGIYTLGEMLRQHQPHRPLEIGVGCGWHVRVDVPRFATRMHPNVSVWPDQLVFGFTDDMLRRFVMRACQMRNWIPNPVEVGAMVPTAFPASYRLETAQPLKRVVHPERMFFDEQRMVHSPHDSFWLRSPLVHDSVAVALVRVEDELVATVPVELVDAMLKACETMLIAQGR